MSRIIRLGIAAGLALAASAAWATSAKSDEKAAGGDVWYDEFYASTSPGPATSTPVAAVTSSASRVSAAAVQQPHKRARAGERAPARGEHRRLARSR